MRCDFRTVYHHLPKTTSSFACKKAYPAIRSWPGTLLFVTHVFHNLSQAFFADPGFANLNGFICHFPRHGTNIPLSMRFEYNLSIVMCDIDQIAFFSWKLSRILFRITIRPSRLIQLVCLASPLTPYVPPKLFK